MASDNRIKKGKWKGLDLWTVPGGRTFFARDEAVEYLAAVDLLADEVAEASAVVASVPEETTGDGVSSGGDDESRTEG